MSSFSFDAALAVFGGWPGIAAFYGIGLAFPISYATRKSHTHEQHDAQRRFKELRLAGYVVVASAALFLVWPSSTYLQRHVPQHRRMLAGIADWGVALIVTYILAPLAGLSRIRGRLRADRTWLSIEVPDPVLIGEEASKSVGPRVIANTQTELLTQQTWQVLFVSWVMTIMCGILTFCLGHVVHDVSWWHLPLYNIGGHLALLQAVAGLTEACFLPFRAGIVRTALECRTLEERGRHFRDVMKTMASTRIVSMVIFIGIEDVPPRDVESAPGGTQC